MTRSMLPEWLTHNPREGSSVKYALLLWSVNSISIFIVYRGRSLYFNKYNFWPIMIMSLIFGFVFGVGMAYVTDTEEAILS